MAFVDFNAGAAAPAPAVLGAAALATRRRAAILRWLRKVHGWLGLWGAVFGFLFGATGIVLAHRSVLHLPITKVEQSVVHYRLTSPPSAAEDLARRIAAEFGFGGQAPRVKVEPARPVAWNGVAVVQPERWEIRFDHPRRGARIEYFVGNGFARIEKLDATAIGTLTRLHMATGVDAFWVLLVDAFAGSLMLLALSGTVLWTQLRPPRAAAAAVLLAAPLLGVGWLALS